MAAGAKWKKSVQNVMPLRKQAKKQAANPAREKGAPATPPLKTHLP